MPHALKSGQLYLYLPKAHVLETQDKNERILRGGFVNIVTKEGTEAKLKVYVGYG